MPASKYTDEEILQILRSHAQRLGKPTLSKKEVASVIPVSTVGNRFGSLGNALERAGLTRISSSEHLKGRGPTLSEDELFNALSEVESKLGKEPTTREYAANGKFSQRPYLDRYGNWPDVLAYYRRWKKQNREMRSSDAKDKPRADADKSYGISVLRNEHTTVVALDVNKRKPPQQFYGEPIDFRGLRHAPINEQGVVFLFGLVSRELGFNIESVQQGFPDCEGKYLHDQKKNLWAKARIEFEYKSSNFDQHGHNPDQCDFIVCWVNDWPECPVNVIELKSEILKLSPR